MVVKTENNRLLHIVLLSIGAFLVAMLVLFIVSTRTPVKYAVRLDDLAESGESYYLVQWIEVTGSYWEIVGDQDGYYSYSEIEYIVTEGKMPYAVINYSVILGQNTYICYGEYVGESENTDIREVFSKYRFTDWDIVYPVKRDTILPAWFYPDGYLSKADFRENKGYGSLCEKTEKTGDGSPS